MADKREILRQIERLSELKTRGRYPPEFKVWQDQTERVLNAIFGLASDQLRQFKELEHEPFIISSNTPESEFDTRYQNKLKKYELMLNSFIEDLDVKQDDKGLALSLTCPVCKSIDPQYLEIRDVGTRGLRAGVPVVGGSIENIKALAYYQCKVCHRVFSIEIQKA